MQPSTLSHTILYYWLILRATRSLIFSGYIYIYQSTEYPNFATRPQNRTPPQVNIGYGAMDELK